LFEMTFIDENSGTPVFRAASAGALSNDELKSSALRASSIFYTGDIAALLDGSPLEQVLLTYLEAAYQAGEQGHNPTDDTLVYLAPEQ
jgi:serine/threonine-protein kinase